MVFFLKTPCLPDRLSKKSDNLVGRSGIFTANSRYLKFRQRNAFCQDEHFFCSQAASCPADVLSAGHVQIELKVIVGIYFKLTEQGVVFWAMGGTWIFGCFPGL